MTAHSSSAGVASRPRYILTVTLNAAIDVTLIVPSLELGTSSTAPGLLKLPGGKGLNVARVLRALDIPVCATGFAGGYPAAFITGGLAAEGIEPRFQPITATSRTCTAVVETAHQRATEINEPGPTVTADEMDGFRRMFAGLLPGAALVALSGSLPRGVPDDFYATLIALARSAGVPVALDTSGRGLAPGIAAGPLLVKPNAKEAGELLGSAVETDADALRAARLLRERGAGMALVTLGSAGALLAHPCGVWRVHTEQIVPVSTVGCGDAFIAGVIAGLYRAQAEGSYPSLDAAADDPAAVTGALALGAACGAANALELGAGRLDPREVMRLRSTARVETLV